MKTFLIHLLLWLPAVLGGLFIAVVKLDHRMFQEGIIGARGAIGIEFIYLIVCAAGSLTSAGVAIQLAKERKFWGIVCAAISILVGVILLDVGFESGAAILHAT